MGACQGVVEPTLLAASQNGVSRQTSIQCLLDGVDRDRDDARWAGLEYDRPTEEPFVYHAPEYGAFACAQRRRHVWSAARISPRWQMLWDGCCASLDRRVGMPV